MYPVATLFLASLILLVLHQKGLLSFGSYSFHGRSTLIGICLMACGWMFSYAQDPKQNPRHLLYQAPSDYLLTEVEEVSYRQKKVHKIVTRVLASYSGEKASPMIGRVVFYNSDSVFNTARPGDHWLISGSSLSQISPPSNPGQFDYAAFMARKGIFHQAFIRQGDACLLHESTSTGIQHQLYEMRNRMVQSLSYLPKDERALAQALLVGIKDDLSPELKNNFSKTGAMHVLAVSGLHVGIIYWILSRVLLLLTGFKESRYLRLLLMLAGLWAYAIITGLPPSVQRATLMFSLIAIASELQRNANSLNTVLISAFLLLAYQPNLIRDVGFQLSYSAVFGIIILQPAIAKWWRPKGYLLQFIWGIFSVSIAAQLATLPFTLYYFHQFPVWFLLSNLVAIPAAFLIVSGGILLPLFQLAGSAVYEVYQWCYQKLLSAFLTCIDFIAQLPFAHIHHVYIDLLDVIFLFVAVALVGRALLLRKLRFMKWAFLVLIIQQSTHIVQRQFLLPQQEFVVFDTGKNSTYGLKHPDRAAIFMEEGDTLDRGFSTEGFFGSRSVIDSFSISESALPAFITKSSFYLPEHRIHIVEHYLPDTNAFEHFIIHRRSPIELIQKLPPGKCIFDSSVRVSGFLAKYPKFAPAHFVSRDGAFLIQTP